MRAAIVAALFAVFCVSAAAQGGKPPEAADLLFETPQWSLAEPGATLTYRYARKSPNEAQFGPSFEDSIRLHVDKSETRERRTVRVELFSGERRRAAGPFEDTSANPVLILFLEHHLRELAPRLKANPRYIKNAIRAALRDKARVEAGQVSVGGRSLPATTVTIRPFIDDPNKNRMNGLDALTYTFTVADGLPGQIVDIHVQTPATGGAASFDERLVYVPTNG